MPVISDDLLSGVLTQFRALFAQEFLAGRALAGWRDLVMNMPSTGEQNTYEWFGTPGDMEDVTDKVASREGVRALRLHAEKPRFPAGY